MLNNQNAWSDWLDFNEDTISKIPQSAGVYMMHASMKILFIGGSENIKTSIQDKDKDRCVSRATRVRYMQTLSHEQMVDDLIKDYQYRHGGKLPQCMELH
jgi:excinuclease UvrABC nuclease subunit